MKCTFPVDVGEYLPSFGLVDFLKNYWHMRLDHGDELVDPPVIDCQPKERVGRLWCDYRRACVCRSACSKE